jgi:hypothetical protein
MSNVKSIAKDFVGRTSANRFAWSAYRACGIVGHYLGQLYGHARWARETRDRDELQTAVIDEMFPDLTVASGPFKGMRYPDRRSVGSALLPKLLGSYESELHFVLEELLSNQYTAVVDIGCAEGYYAVGLGLRLKAAEIYAFDIDDRARRACSDMARLNGIGPRVHVAGLCDQKVLQSIPLGLKALIVSDCEGYERELFAGEMKRVLARHDLIIETHDFIDIDISQALRDTFADTHTIQSITSTDDIMKAHRYDYARLSGFDTAKKRLILGERRPAIMEWLVMTPSGSTVAKDS